MDALPRKHLDQAIVCIEDKGKNQRSQLLCRFSGWVMEYTLSKPVEDANPLLANLDTNCILFYHVLKHFVLYYWRLAALGCLNVDSIRTLILHMFVGVKGHACICIFVTDQRRIEKRKRKWSVKTTSIQKTAWNFEWYEHELAHNEVELFNFGNNNNWLCIRVD